MEAAQQSESLTQWLARSQPRRARERGAQKIAGCRVVPDVVPAGAANQLHPRQLVVAPRSELDGTRQRLLRSLVMRAEELDPADLTPGHRRDVVSPHLLRQRRPLVQRRRAFLVRA